MGEKALGGILPGLLRRVRKARALRVCVCEISRESMPAVRARTGLFEEIYVVYCENEEFVRMLFTLGVSTGARQRTYDGNPRHASILLHIINQYTRKCTCMLVDHSQRSINSPISRFSSSLMRTTLVSFLRVFFFSSFFSQKKSVPLLKLWEVEDFADLVTTLPKRSYHHLKLLI